MIYCFLMYFFQVNSKLFLRKFLIKVKIHLLPKLISERFHFEFLSLRLSTTAKFDCQKNNNLSHDFILYISVEKL